jgi:hypothetical protein
MTGPGWPGIAIKTMTVVIALGIGGVGCSARHGSAVQPCGSAFPAAAPLPADTAPASQPVVEDAPLADYTVAVDDAVRLHLKVWIEADMVKRWLDGPASFRDAVKRVAALANRPGVAGIKIADELGYHDGLGSCGKVRQFLADTAAALRHAAPGKLLLADMVLPALGCMPGQPAGPGPAGCATAAQARYPQLALAEVDGYLRMHAIDVLDLSTGILPDSTYTAWATTPAAAQQAAWRELARRGWASLVRLQARKALAHPGSYRGTPAQTAADMHTFVDIPLANGAQAVDVWTWHQEYKGAMYRLMNPALRPNALWDELRQRRHAHDVLFTHMSPHSVEFGVNSDLAVIASVFTDVFLPAGTG